MPDPYDLFLSMLAGAASGTASPLCPGEVLEGGQGKLRVFADGYPLEKEELMVNPLYRWDWEPVEDVGQPELLRKGEHVLLCALPDPVEGKVYYLICKVVRP